MKGSRSESNILRNAKRPGRQLFDTISTEESAYWFGFIYADGNVRQDLRALRVNFGIKDVEHAQKFADIFGAIVRYNKCGKGHRGCYVAVNSKYLCRGLEAKGVVRNKRRRHGTYKKNIHK